MDNSGPQLISTQSISDQGELSSPISGVAQRYRLVREMADHPTIKLARYLCIAPALASDWSVSIADGLDPAVQELVKEQIFPHKAQFLERALLGMVDFGWAPFEFVWNGYDLDRIKPLLHDITTILVDAKTGDLAGLKQEQQGASALGLKDEVIIDTPKAVVVAQGVEGTNWYGKADSDAAIHYYKRWKEVDVTAARHDEKVAGAHWIIHFPVGTSRINGEEIDNGEIAKKLLASLVASGGVTIPTSVSAHLHDMEGDKSARAWEIELIESSSAAASAYETRLKYIDSAMVRAYLQPERTLTEGKNGTKAESSVHQSVALTMVQHRHAIALQQLVRQAVNPLVEAHFGPDYINKVLIESESLDSDKQQFVREVYKAILDRPDGSLLEIPEIDMGQLRDVVGIPALSGERDTLISEPFQPEN